MSVGPDVICQKGLAQSDRQLLQRKGQDTQRQRSLLSCCQQWHSTRRVPVTRASAAISSPFKVDLQGQEEQVLLCHLLDERYPRGKKAALLDEAFPPDSGEAQPACRLRPRAPGAG